MYRILVRVIQFLESSVVYRVEDDSPWEVYCPDTDEWRLARTLMPDMRVKSASGILTVSMIFLDNSGDEVRTLAEALRQETRVSLDWPFGASSTSTTVPIGDSPPTVPPARGLAIGDGLCSLDFTFVVESIDSDAEMIHFEGGGRLPFTALRPLNHLDGAPILLPYNVRTAEEFVAVHTPHPLRAFHIATPGWYNLPGLGSTDLSHIDADSYITYDASNPSIYDITEHTGDRFRALYTLSAPLPVVAVLEHDEPLSAGEHRLRRLRQG